MGEPAVERRKTPSAAQAKEHPSHRMMRGDWLRPGEVPKFGTIHLGRRQNLSRGQEARDDAADGEKHWKMTAHLRIEEKLQRREECQGIG